MKLSFLGAPTLWVAVTLLFVLIPGGCGAKSITPQPINAVGDHVSKATVYVETTDKSVTKAKPYTNSIGKIYLDSATDTLVGARDELKGAKKELGTANQQVLELRDKSILQQQILDGYYNRWVGDRTIRWFYWILGVWVGMGILGIVLKVFTGGWLSFMGGQIMNLLPLAQPFVWIGKWLVQKRGG